MAKPVVTEIAAAAPALATKRQETPTVRAMSQTTPILAPPVRKAAPRLEMSGSRVTEVGRAGQPKTPGPGPSALPMSPAEAISQFQRRLDRTEGVSLTPALTAPIQLASDASISAQNAKPADTAAAAPQGQSVPEHVAIPPSPEDKHAPSPARAVAHAKPAEPANPACTSPASDFTPAVDAGPPQIRLATQDPASVVGGEPSKPPATDAPTLPPRADVPPVYPSAAQSTALPPAVSSNAARHSAAKPFATSIAHSVTQTGHSRAEIVLEPAELGRVHFNLVTDGAQVQINLCVERPETLALMRAHAEALRQEFRAAGLDTSSLSFGHWDQRGDSRAQPVPRAEDGVPVLTDAPLLPVPPPPAVQPGAGLDLRL